MRPRLFTPHPENVEYKAEKVDWDSSKEQEMETQIGGSDTVLNIPECPTTPLKQINKSNLWQIHLKFLLNADLKAAGDEGIYLT